MFQLFDYYAASGMVLLLFCFFESIAMGWVYGGKNFYENIEDMIGRKLCPWLRFCWQFVTPAITMVSLLCNKGLTILI